MLFVSALLLGLAAGLRSMTPPATIALAARAGRLSLAGTYLSFLNHPVSAIVFCLFALGEFIADKLPFIPSRKDTFPFAVRILVGAFAGIALGLNATHPSTAIPLFLCIALGVIGAVVGTLAGHAFRARLAASLHKDFPAAVIEDLVALALAFLAYRLLPAPNLL